MSLPKISRTQASPAAANRGWHSAISVFDINKEALLDLLCDIKQGKIQQVQPLEPASKLRSRLVTIKGYTEPALFVGAVHRQLAALEVVARVGIPANLINEPKRLTLKIKGYSIVGFSVVVSGLSPIDSLKLQVHGLGGKRRIGCGVFTGPAAAE